MQCDDNTIPENRPPLIALDLVQKAMQNLGCELPDGEKLKRKLEKTGFVDIRVKTLKLPVGPWPKNPTLEQTGSLALGAAKTGYEAYGLHLMTSVLDVPTEESADICAKATVTHSASGAMEVHSYMYQ